MGAGLDSFYIFIAIGYYPKLVQYSWTMNIMKSDLYMGDEFEIDLELFLQTLAKLKQGDFSNFTEIENIESHIQNLRNAISHELSHL